MFRKNLKWQVANLQIFCIYDVLGKYCKLALEKNQLQIREKYLFSYTIIQKKQSNKYSYLF